jgi:hypothetical protein
VQVTPASLKYILCGESLMRYTKRCLNDSTACGP